METQFNREEANNLSTQEITSSTFQQHNSAYYAFLYLLLFFSLSFLSTGIGSILFEVINKFFPDEVADSVYYFGDITQTAIKYGIASIIISGPIFFGVSYLVHTYLKRGILSESSKVRLWITYVIIFIVSSIILVDLVTFIFNVLDGELVARIFLKVCVVFFIAGSILGYYFWDIRKNNVKDRNYTGDIIALALSILIIIVVLALSFFVIDNPITTRNKKLDKSIVSALSSYAMNIGQYYNTHNDLPNSLSDLESINTLKKRPGSTTITYIKKDNLTYQLCADFKRSNKDDKDEDNGMAFDYSLIGDGNDSNESWRHDKGHYCFDKKITTPSYLKNNALNSGSGGNELDEINDGLVDDNEKNQPADFFHPAIGSSQSSAESNNYNEINLIKSEMSSVNSFAIICRARSGTILSGKGGDKLCSADQSMKWPTIKTCGGNAIDTQWTVFNGNNDKWDITLNCANEPACNGPQEAICKESGCVFQGECNSY